MSTGVGSRIADRSIRGAVDRTRRKHGLADALTDADWAKLKPLYGAIFEALLSDPQYPAIRTLFENLAGHMAHTARLGQQVQDLTDQVATLSAILTALGAELPAAPSQNLKGHEPCETFRRTLNKLKVRQEVQNGDSQNDTQISDRV